MKYLAPYRLATYLLLFFAFAHTAGGLLGPRDEGVEGAAVFHAMQAVTFTVMGATCSWYGYWLGFGLMVSVFLVFSAVVTWQLASLTRAQRRPLALVTWALCATFVASAGLSWAYFFAPPALTSTLVALLVGVECVRDGRAAA